jgi:protein subunit release factor A
MQIKKELVCSVTRKDLRVDTFCSGGPGGMNQNKRKTGVRITHPGSGAVGESRQHRTQWQNKKAALRRLAEHPKMQQWARLQAAKSAGLESRVDQMMKNVRTEVRRDGRWVDAD